MRRACFAAALCWLLVLATAFADDAASPFAQWEPAVAAFEKAEATSPPPKGAVLFVGQFEHPALEGGEILPEPRGHQPGLRRIANRGLGALRGIAWF